MEEVSERPSGIDGEGVETAPTSLHLQDRASRARRRSSHECASIHEHARAAAFLVVVGGGVG